MLHRFGCCSVTTPSPPAQPLTSSYGWSRSRSSDWVIKLPAAARPRERRTISMNNPQATPSNSKPATRSIVPPGNDCGGIAAAVCTGGSTDTGVTGDSATPGAASSTAGCSITRGGVSTGTKSVSVAGCGGGVTASTVGIVSTTGAGGVTGCGTSGFGTAGCDKTSAGLGTSCGAVRGAGWSGCLAFKTGAALPSSKA